MFARQLCKAAAVSMLFILSACGTSYDRYMQDGKNLRSQRDFSGARQRFHNAALVTRHDPKQQEMYIEALLSEKDCAVDLQKHDEAVVLLADAAGLLEKKESWRQAAELQKQMGDLSLSVNAEQALAYYDAALADLKNAGLEISVQTADDLAAIGDLKSGQNDFKSAAGYMEKSCALLEKINNAENNHAQAVYLYKLAFIYQQLDRENESTVINQKARALEISGINARVHKLPRF